MSLSCWQIKFFVKVILEITYFCQVLNEKSGKNGEVFEIGERKNLVKSRVDTINQRIAAPR